MILTAADQGMTQEDVDKAVESVPEGDLVGAAPYWYETVRINDTPVMAAATDLEGAKKTSPFWRIDGDWPASGQVLVGKSVAETYSLKVGKKIAATFAPETEEKETASESAQESGQEPVMDNSIDLTVAGILDTGGKEENYIYMTLDDMQQLTGKEVSYDLCELSVSATETELSAIADQINSNVKAVTARLVRKVTQSETTVLSKLQSLVFLVTIVVLALTMICVATTMTAVVAERRKEIGLRKALGASNTSIVREFMGEGLVLGAFGGLIGSFLGFAFAQLISVNVFNSTIILMPWLVPVTILASLVVTGLACLIPIRSATYVDPALVLKGE